MPIYQVYLDSDTHDSLIDIKRNWSFDEVMTVIEAMRDRDEAKALISDDIREQQINQET